MSRRDHELSSLTVDVDCRDRERRTGRRMTFNTMKVLTAQFYEIQCVVSVARLNYLKPGGRYRYIRDLKALVARARVRLTTPCFLFREAKTRDADASTKCRRIFGLRRLRVPDTGMDDEGGQEEDGRA